MDKFKLQPAFIMWGQPKDFAAIGRFIAACCFIETSLHTAFKHLLGIDDALARGLFGEASISDLSNKLHLVAKQKGMPAKYLSAIDTLRMEIAYINKIRSWIAHKPFGVSNETLIFHNVLTAKTLSAAQAYRCTALQLENGADYATHISDCLISLKNDSQPIPSEYLARVSELVASRKKLDLPASPKETSPPNPQKQKRPQRSSQR